MTGFIKLRGEEYEVEYHNHGWEPDTNAHEIDWEFVGEGWPNDLTAEEEESIWLQLAERDEPRFEDDVI